MKSKNNTNSIKLKKYYLLIIAIILVICAIFGINKLRPIPKYTLYRIQMDGTKEKIKTIKSLNVARKEIYKYSDPKNNVNSSVEDEKGQRVAIAYGIVNLKQSNHQPLKYYDEHFDKSQTLQPSFGSDALYQNTRSINGKLQVQFQISTSVGLVDLANVELLNIFDKKEVSSFTHYVVKEGTLYHIITNDNKKSDSLIEIPLGKAPTKFKDGTYYSWDGANFYKNLELLLKEKTEQKKIKKSHIKYTIPYIFQDISIDTNYTMEELNDYISKHLDEDSILQNSAAYFFKAQEEYNINALALFSIACLESEYGTSKEAIKNNVLFEKQDTKKFNSPSDSIDDYAKNILNKQYLQTSSSTFNGNYLGTKAEGINYSYTGDSYWGEKVISIYSSIDNQLGLKDKKIKISKLKEQ